MVTYLPRRSLHGCRVALLNQPSRHAPELSGGGGVVGEWDTFLYSRYSITKGNHKQAHMYYVVVYVKSGYVVSEMAVKHIFYYCLYIVAYLL